MDDRVNFLCARGDHRRSEPNDALTMHQDRWAYCPGGAAKDHDWHLIPAGGMSLDDAKRFMSQRPIDPVDSTAQRSD
jgi:hypothetical protein